MFAIAKIDSTEKFRKDMFKSKRKELNEIWNGDYYKDLYWQEAEENKKLKARLDEIARLSEYE